MNKTQVGELDIPIGGQILSQPKTTHIPDLKNDTSNKIYELRASLKVKKQYVTATINDAEKTKGKLELKMVEQETRPDSYGIQAIVLTLKSKTEKINALIDVLDEHTMEYEQVLESCKLKYPVPEQECDYFLQCAAEHKIVYTSEGLQQCLYP